MDDKHPVYDLSDELVYFPFFLCPSHPDPKGRYDEDEARCEADHDGIIFGVFGQVLIKVNDLQDYLEIKGTQPKVMKDNRILVVDVQCGVDAKPQEGQTFDDFQDVIEDQVGILVLVDVEGSLPEQGFLHRNILAALIFSAQRSVGPFYFDCSLSHLETYFKISIDVNAIQRRFDLAKIDLEIIICLF